MYVGVEEKKAFISAYSFFFIIIIFHKDFRAL